MNKVKELLSQSCGLPLSCSIFGTNNLAQGWSMIFMEITDGTHIFIRVPHGNGLGITKHIHKGIPVGFIIIQLVDGKCKTQYQASEK